MKYSAYGLDETKKSKDEGEVTADWLCVFCAKTVSKGFGLCFSNWVMCLDCVSNTADEKRWETDKECFKCGEVKPKGFKQHEMYQGADLHICQKCIDWAKQVTSGITKTEDVLKDVNGQTFLDFN